MTRWLTSSVSWIFCSTISICRTRLYFSSWSWRFSATMRLRSSTFFTSIFFSSSLRCSAWLVALRSLSSVLNSLSVPSMTPNMRRLRCSLPLNLFCSLIRSSLLLIGAATVADETIDDLIVGYLAKCHGTMSQWTKEKTNYYSFILDSSESPRRRHCLPMRRCGVLLDCSNDACWRLTIFFLGGGRE